MCPMHLRLHMCPDATSMLPLEYTSLRTDVPSVNCAGKGQFVMQQLVAELRYICAGEWQRGW